MSPACVWWTPSRTCCACSRTRPSLTKKARWTRCATWRDVETELVLSDFAVIEKRLERLDKDRKKIKNPELDREFELLTACKTALEENRPLRQLEFGPEDEKRIRGFQFLSQKPVLYVLNLGEEESRPTARTRTGLPGRAAGRAPAHLGHRGLRQDRGRAGRTARRGASRLPGQLRPEESGLQRLISATYALLGLMSFLTAGEDEVRAWTIPMNSPAVKAAGAIHSDSRRSSSAPKW